MIQFSELPKDLRHSLQWTAEYIDDWYGGRGEPNKAEVIGKIFDFAQEYHKANKHVGVMAYTKQILFEVAEERKRQDKKWGEQNHKPIEWCAILGEEVGEVNKCVVESKWAIDQDYEREQLQEYRKELIQVAAVAVSMIESLERNQRIVKEYPKMKAVVKDSPNCLKPDHLILKKE